MYGFTGAGQLDFLIGTEVEQICLGAHDFQIRLYPDERISIFSRAVLHDPGLDGAHEWSDDTARQHSYMVRLLNQQITTVHVISDDLMRITFSGGDQLEIYDDMKQYEACTFASGNRPLVVV